MRAMLQGILFTRFDIKLGPIAEAMFPENFINQALVFELSFRIWTGSGMLNLSEAKGFTYTFYDTVNFFGCTWFDEDKGLGNFGITAFFSKEDSEIIAPNSDIFKEELQKCAQQIISGQTIQSALENLFKKLNIVINKLSQEGKAEEKIDINEIKELLDILKSLSDAIDNINNFNLRLLLKGLLDKLSERIIKISINLLGEKKTIDLIKSTLI